MELFDVEPARVADTLSGTPASRTAPYVYAIAGLIVLRCVAAAILPLSFDEAYYWLWSKHLAAGYFDHPPVIAFAIRAGTDLFGRSEWGVRAASQLFSVLASWAVWRGGAEAFGSEEDGARASLFFNLTLMTNVEMLTATPDAPLMAFSALFVLALMRLRASGDGRWWLAVGAAGGLALLSKYTALFLGAGALTWMIAAPDGRRWLASPWPYLGGLLAMLFFAPDILWNAQHDWISFRFQFGKAANPHFAPQYLVEFLAAQAALATPLLLVLSVGGLARRRGLLLMLCAPAIAFFVMHALQARVQGNWPSFLYPALAIAAASGWRQARSRFERFCAHWAMPVAALFLTVTYGQALFAPLPIADPTAHLLGDGFAPLAQRIADLRARNHADGLVTSSYALTGWLAFYAPDHAPTLQWNEPQRWLAAPRASAQLMAQPMLYVAEPRRDQAHALSADFRGIRLLATLPRIRAGRTVDRYNVYLVEGWRGGAPLPVVN